MDRISSFQPLSSSSRETPALTRGVGCCSAFGGRIACFPACSLLPASLAGLLGGPAASRDWRRRLWRRPSQPAHQARGQRRRSPPVGQPGVGGRRRLAARRCWGGHLARADNIRRRRGRDLAAAARRWRRPSVDGRHPPWPPPRRASAGSEPRKSRLRAATSLRAVAARNAGRWGGAPPPGAGAPCPTGQGIRNSFAKCSVSPQRPKVQTFERSAVHRDVK